MKARAVAQFRRPALNPRPPASSPAASPLPGFALPAGMQRWLAILLLVAAPLAALAPVCTHDFLNYDDFDQVAANPAYRPVTGHSLIEWWTAPRMDLYMPVTYTVWGIIALDAYHPAYNTTPAHLDPVPFHVANLLVHVMCGLVVFVLLEMLMRAGFTPPLGTPGGGRGGGERAARTNAAARGEASAPTLTPPRSTRGGEKSGPGFQAFGCIWPAVIGALLFELHPMQVEAVAWMSEFNTVLSALLALCAIWQYLRAVRTRGGSRGGPAWRWHYAAAMLLYLLATLAKPGAVVAPLIAGVLDVMILRRS
ncbi:MAG TPA: hypothetical protein VHY37_08335, partial [Tepidisphaeraceae bacterium]|nr:hypothetical protein [Tepidisphaeraceae bacterium]